MKNHYETVFIVTPVLSEAQMKETVQKFREMLNDNGANIVHEEDWGMKKLAYPIQKKSTGFYQLIEFEAETEFIEALELSYRRDERIIRFLTIRMDKYALAYAEKKRKRNADKKEA